MIRKYCIQDIITGKWLYIIPRHISEDNLENGFAKYRFKIGHGKQTAETMIGAVKMVENVQYCTKS